MKSTEIIKTQNQFQILKHDLRYFLFKLLKLTKINSLVFITCTYYAILHTFFQ